MKLFYGNYTALQEHFAHYVAQQRQNPLDKWLIVCASSLMRETLQKKLSGQTGAIANIHFIAAGGLMSRLDEEAGGSILPLLPQDNLRDFILKDLLEEPSLKRYPVTRGFLQAVKSALRDLADSCISPETLAEYERSLPDDALVQDRERFCWLVRLYQRYQQRENEIDGFRSYQNAYERALEQAENSPFLQSFSQIIIYGFYELPGRQWDLISRVRNTYPGAVFVPYEKHPAYKFAERFFKSNWLVPDAKALPAPPCALGDGAPYLFAATGSGPAPQVSLVSALNQTGEVFFTAKEILRLHNEQHIPFSEMAVVARTTGEYQEEVRRSFKQNCIALDASFSYPLSHYALGSFCQRLFALAASGFAREEVLALVSSPYFKHERKRAWSALIRRSLVKRDLSQWRDLLPNMAGYEPEFLACLEDIARRLTQLEQAQTWTKGVKAAQALLRQYVDSDSFEGKDSEIYASVCETVTNLLRYKLVRKKCRDSELLGEINDGLNALVFNETEQSAGGVTFTDAIRARGLQFKVVFILGLNDQSFPLVTPEDPLLRDYYRYVVRDVLGGIINGSLERADEEKLLFYAACGSARERLYILYARQNADGKPAIPSLYLTEISRACELGIEWNNQGLCGDRLTLVSGRLSAQLAQVDISLWTPKELSYAFVLHPQNALENYARAGMLNDRKTQSLKAGEQLAHHGEMGGFDGFIQSGTAIFNAQNVKGFSPSSLQTLAKCPLKYFFDKGLGLGREEDLLNRDGLAPNLRGTICHKILQDFYQTLKDKHLTRDLFASGAAKILQDMLDKNLQKQDYRKYGIYPLFWEFILEDIKTRLSDFVVQDLADLGDFIPWYFETEEFTPATEELPFCLHGYIDRIDVDEPNKLLRVADYKLTNKGTKDLGATFFKNLIFQPFVYLFMIFHSKAFASYKPTGFSLLGTTEYKKCSYTIAQYEAVAPRVFDFLNCLAGYIKQGTFFICPKPSTQQYDNYCMFCPYGGMCRKDHFATLQRVSKSIPSQTLKEFRQ